jgi:two-component system, chemotaxis family, protein-glutamate methylesterase/glutaminase
MDAIGERILQRLRHQHVRTIVMGASAGAIDALSQLLPMFKASTQWAVVAVVHLPPYRRSMLTSIFQAKCALRVLEANDKQSIEPTHVYFAPPGYHLLIERSHVFSLSADDPVHFSRPSIDVLFESAADAFRNELAGVLLTGANQDGAAGLRAISNQGGIAMVQDPGEAEAPMMPQSALDCCQKLAHCRLPAWPNYLIDSDTHARNLWTVSSY